METSQISPKVTTATASAAAAVLILWGLQSINVDALDGPAGTAVDLIVTALLTFAGGWVRRDPLRG